MSQADDVHQPVEQFFRILGASVLVELGSLIESRSESLSVIHESRVSRSRTVTLEEGLPVGATWLYRWAFNEGEALEDLLQVHHLSGDELGDREPDDIDGLVDVSDDAPRLCTGQPVRFGAKTQHDLVAVDGVDIEVDSGS
jgi:hypothetical protein